MQQCVIENNIPNIPNSKISTRITQEYDYPIDFDTRFDLQTLYTISEKIIDIQNLKSQIQDLKHYKLMLANDYDFTHGNNIIQRTIFGDNTKFDI